ncbi:MAG: sigma factor, partial [Myxococcota bacterium]
MPTKREAEGRRSISKAPCSAPADRRAALDSGPDPAAQRSDQELVDGILVSDEACFNELYERYFNRVYAYSYRRVRNHADAEEVTQEAFVSVFKSISNFRGQSSLISW